MVQLTALTVSGVLDTPQPAGVKSPVSGLFACALAVLGKGEANAESAIDGEGAFPDQRHDPAAPGKELPVDQLMSLLPPVDGDVADEGAPVDPATPVNEQALRKSRRPGVDDAAAMAVIATPQTIPVAPTVAAATPATTTKVGQGRMPAAVIAVPSPSVVGTETTSEDAVMSSGVVPSVPVPQTGAQMTAPRAIAAAMTQRAVAPETPPNLVAGLADSAPSANAPLPPVASPIASQARVDAAPVSAMPLPALDVQAPQPNEGQSPDRGSSATLRALLNNSKAIVLPAAPVVAAPSLTPSSVAQPAGQAFAAAMFVAERPGERKDKSQPDASALTLVTGAAPTDAASAPVAAASQTHDAPLDTSRDEWIGKMIERIETLRDEGTGVRETRIRLAPEALGRVDVSIRHSGDAVSVQLTAENPAARQLLAEAAPRLTEMAEGRGLKLDQSGVNGGNAGTDNGRARADQQRDTMPQAPASAFTAEAEDGTDQTDTRIA